MEKEILDIFKVSDAIDIPDSVARVLNDIDRDKVYNELIKIHKGDLSYDWFQGVYESELAQRNQNKQDFTPNSVGLLLSKLTGVHDGKIYEPTAGNGSLIISNWNYRRSMLAELFVSKEHPIECWELSKRSIPILLLNLSIRGIIGEVYHGNVLTKEFTTKYILSSEGGFSTIK